MSLKDITVYKEMSKELCDKLRSKCGHKKVIISSLTVSGSSILCVFCLIVSCRKKLDSESKYY